MKKKLIISAIILVITISGVLVAYKFRPPKASKPDTRPDLAEQLLLSELRASASEKTELVERYGDQYDKINQELDESDPASWDKDMLNRAYFVLTYANKMGQNQRAYEIISMLYTSREAGVDIDNNDLGFDDAKRQRVLDSFNEGVSRNEPLSD